MRRDDFPPDYTPFSLSGSAHADGDRQIESKLSPSTALIVFLFAFPVILGLLSWIAS